MPATYTISERLYVIHDRPLDESPLVRLQSEGAEVVPTRDLLRIALGGAEGAAERLGEYGLQAIAGIRSVPEAMELLQIDRAQATRLLAVLGLGRRLYGRQQGSLTSIRGPEDVYQHCRSMANLPKEHLRLLLVNSRYQLIHEETLAIGSVEQLAITPRDVFQPAIERRVSAVVLVHNHPSGDPTPSQSDLAFTESVCQAGRLLGVEVLDHLVIGSDRYASCLPKDVDK